MSEIGKSNDSQVLRRLWDAGGMVLICVALFALCAVFVPNFASAKNMGGLALAITTIGLLSCTMLFCLASGQFDLSIGSVVACSGVCTAVLVNQPAKLLIAIGAFFNYVGLRLFHSDWSAFQKWAESLHFSSGGAIAIAILGGLFLGGVVGFINGYIIARLKINALITTLATMQIVRGLGYIVSDGKAVGISNEDFFNLGIGQFLGWPMPVWLMLGAFITFGLLMQMTVFGRNTLALGGNEEAARLAGIKVDRLKIGIFVMQGLMAGFAGIVLAARMTSGQPMTSQGLELEVISACVLGGVSMTGGVGNMVAVVAGVLIMGVMQNAMNLLNVESFWQYVARGAILLAAVLFDRFKQR